MEQTISIEKILKELYHISGFRISVYDTYFQEIAAFPKELGCLCSLIQENPEGRKHWHFVKYRMKNDFTFINAT